MERIRQGVVPAATEQTSCRDPSAGTGIGGRSCTDGVVSEERKMSRENIIRDTAYAIWEAEGRPEGRAREHWSMAERQIADTSRNGSLREDSAETTATDGKTQHGRRPKATSASGMAEKIPAGKPPGTGTAGRKGPGRRTSAPKPH
jgi:hypothetical protein